MSGESIRVQIFGRDFPVRVRGGDAERAQRVAARVDETMRMIARSSGRASTQEVAILAALNFAEQIERGPSGVDAQLDRLNSVGKELEQALNRADALLAQP